MAVNLEELATELLALPGAARAFLAEKLVESLDDFVEPDIQAAWSAEIERRVKEVEEGKVAGVPAEEVMRNVYRRLHETRRLSSAGAAGGG
jgi:putative addiction module component (TIGR02574 family)